MKRIFSFLTLAIICSDLSAQLTINNTLYSPNQLVDGVLVPTGSGTTISNVTFSGVYNSSNKYQVGHFSTATTTLTEMGFTSGVVLTTGNTSDIPLMLGSNPQAAGQMSTGYTSCTAGEIRETGTCPTTINDLNVLAGSTNYFNGAILEFDFIPISTIVQFRYIFGSEEYNDNSGTINYQCSSYNDKFGFLISGPGIAGGQGFSNNARNIARLANGSEVSINSVNGGIVGSSGGVPSASNCQAANPGWIQNTPTPEYLGTIDGTQLNGNTRILIAEQTGLTPGQTYHIKLIITDVGDAAYDAVVFLEAGSFTTVSCTKPPAPNFGTVTQPTCISPNGSVELTNLPSSGTWTVTATPGNATITGSGTTANFGSLNPNTSYSFTVTNDLGCTSNASSNVLINVAPLNPTAPGIGAITQPTCISLNGSVELTNLPSSGTWTVTATPGNATITGSGTTANFGSLNPNTSYSFTVTNDLGCTSNASSNVLINVVPSNPTAPVIGAITQPTCISPNASIALSGLPSVGSWTLTTSTGNTFTGMGTTYNLTGIAAGTSFTLAVTNSSACTSVNSTTITINAMPTPPSAPLIGSITQATCSSPSGSVLLSGLPATGSWTINSTPPTNSISGSGTSVLVTNLSPNATYSFSVVDQNGCQSSSSANVVLNALPTTITPIASVFNQPTCLFPTGTIEVNTPIGVNYSYSTDGITFQSSPSFSALSPGTYSIFAKDNTTGCISNPIAVIVNSIPNASPVYAGADQTIGSGEVAVLIATGAGTMIWENGDTTQTNVAPQVTTTYTVTMTDSNGCVSTDNVTVYLITDCGELFVPTAFSPNDDAVNSLFRIKINPSCVQEMHLMVFDRWGELVYESTNPNDSWDGKYKRKDLDPAVFVYVLDIMLVGDKEHNRYSGNLTLIK